MACRAIHQVDGQFALSWIEADRVTVAFASAVVLVVVGAEPDGADIPQRWRVTAYPLHHFDQRLAVLGGLLVIKRSDVAVD